MPGRSYDLPTDYNVKLLGMRLSPGACVWRKFTDQNYTEWVDGASGRGP